MQEFLSKIILVLVWFKMILTQISTQAYKDSHTLRYTHQISKFNWYIQIWNPWVGF